MFSRNAESRAFLDIRPTADDFALTVADFSQIRCLFGVGHDQGLMLAARANECTLPRSLRGCCERASPGSAADDADDFAHADSPAARAAPPLAVALAPRAK